MTLVNKIMFGIGAALVLAVLITFVWLSIANAHLKAQLAQAEVNATACHLANDEFTARVAQQNKAVEALQQEGARREKQAQEVAAEAQKTARRYFLAAEKIRDTRTGGDACQASGKLFDVYLDAQK